MVSVVEGAWLAPGARTPTVCTPLRFFLSPMAGLSQNLVTEAPAVPAPLFLTLAVATKLAPGSALPGGDTREFTTRSGLTCASPGAGVRRRSPRTMTGATARIR